MVGPGGLWNKRGLCERWLTMTSGRFTNVGHSSLSEDIHPNRELRWTTSVADIVNGLLSVGVGRHFAELSMDGPHPYFGAVVAESKVLVSCQSQTEASPANVFLATGPSDGGYDVILVDVRHEPKLPASTSSSVACLNCRQAGQLLSTTAIHPAHGTSARSRSSNRELIGPGKSGERL